MLLTRLVLANYRTRMYSVVSSNCNYHVECPSPLSGALTWNNYLVSPAVSSMNCALLHQHRNGRRGTLSLLRQLMPASCRAPRGPTFDSLWVIHISRRLSRAGAESSA